MTVQLAAVERPNLMTWIRMHAFHGAVEDIGRGEEPWRPGGPVKNNGGPWLVRTVRPNDGTQLDADTGGAWCASWVSYRYVMALRAARRYFEVEGLQLGFRTSRSALRLGERLLECGVLVDPADAREGDNFFMTRTGGGHTGWVRGPATERGLPTLDGNVGRVPALVKPLWRDPNAHDLRIVRYGG